MAPHTSHLTIIPIGYSTCIMSYQASDPDPNGDLTLVVGRDSMKIRVSSTRISLASPVFAAMLRPPFFEGRHLLMEGSLTLSLPDEDPETFLFFCHLIHGPKAENGSIRYTLLMELASLCDKYDLSNSLRPWVDMWMCEDSIDAKAEEHEAYPEVLWVAYVFDHHRAFYRFSKIILMSYTSVTQSQNELALAGGILPDRLFRE